MSKHPSDHSLAQYRQLIGRRVRRARMLNGIAVEDLSRMAGVQASDLESIESGRGSLTVDELEKVATILGVPLMQFLGECMLCGSRQ